MIALKKGTFEVKFRSFYDHKIFLDSTEFVGTWSDGEGDKQIILLLTFLKKGDTATGHLCFVPG